MTPGQGDLFEGRRRRDLGVGALDSHDKLFKDHAASIIAIMAATGLVFGPDDIRSKLQLYPSHPNQIGAAFLSAVRRGIIRKVGRRPNTVPSAHAREVNVYQGVI